MSEEDFPPSKIKAIQQIQQAQPQQAPAPKAPSSAESLFSEDVIVGPYAEVKPIAQQAALRTAFDLPKEATDITTKQTAEGIEITYSVPVPQPSWKETTVTGRIYTGEAKGIIPALFPQLFRQDPLVPLMEVKTVAPVREFQAGVAGVFESWVRPEVPTPAGAVVGKVFGQTSAYETGEVSPFYALGGIFGTYVEGKAIGYAVGKVWSGVKHIAPEAFKQPLYEAKEAIRFSRVSKGLHEVKWAIERNIPLWKITQPFTKRLARGEMAIPYIERYGISEIEAETIAWSVMQTPRMGGVMIAREIGESVAKKGVSFSATVLGGFYIKKTTPYLFPREATFTPLVSQAQVTRMGVHPYIPAMAEGFVSKESSTLLGTTISTLIKLRPPERLSSTTVQETFEREREQFRPQTLLAPLPKQKEREFLIPKISQIQGPIPKIKEETSLILKQKTRMMLSTTLKIPTPTKLVPKTTFTPYFPKGGTGSGIGGGFRLGRGSWFFKRHPLPTPSQVLGGFGLPRKRRKHKK